MWIWVCVAIIVVLIIAYVGCLNGLKRSVVKCEEALSDIDVALTKRYDTLTKMLDVTKGYAKHESETLLNVIAARKGVKDMTPAEKAEFDKTLQNVSRELNVVVEQYPELKSSEVFKRLQDSIIDVEEHLQAARRCYNANASDLKQKIVAFPTSLVAKMGHVEAMPMFQAEESKREDVKMNF